MKDIQSRNDIKLLVDEFYSKVNYDPLLGPVFTEIARVNWDDHLPRMVDFWSTLLLGTGEYKGQPFPKHLRLPLTPAHFRRWIELFHTTIDDHFTGPVAQQAKQQSLQIARVFEFKYEQLSGSNKSS